MIPISDDAFEETLLALGEYAQFQRSKHPKDEPKLLLKVTKNAQGEQILQAVSAKELGFRDKVMRFFGLGAFTLRRVVSFLRSEPFSKKIESTTLNGTQRHTIILASTSLDEKIRKFNFFRPFPIRKNLTGTILEHFAHMEALRLAKSSKIYAKAPDIDPTSTSSYKDAAEAAKDGHFLKALTSLKDLNLPSDEHKKACKSLLDIATKSAKARLAYEVLTGRAVVDKSGILQISAKHNWFQEFTDFCADMQKELADSSLSNTPNYLQNWAHTLQEIRKASNRTQEMPPIQNQFVEVLCAIRELELPSTDIVLTYQQESLEALLDNPALLQTSVEDMKGIIETTKQKAHLLACKIPEAEHNDLCKAISSALRAGDALRMVYENEATSFIEKLEKSALPKIAKDSILKEYKQFITRYVKQELAYLMRNDIAQLTAAKRPRPPPPLHSPPPIPVDYSQTRSKGDVPASAVPEPQTPSVFSREEKSPSLIEELFSQFHKEDIVPRLQFFEKWQKNLVKEMRQGYADPGETLGRGICWALSLRWVLEEMNLASGSTVDDAVDKMKIGDTQPIDRMSQAACGLSRKLDKLADIKNIKKRYGIKNTHRVLDSRDLHGKEAIISSLRKLGSHARFQDHGGIGQLGFQWEETGHAICIVCKKDMQHPEKSVFRFSEPNFGTYNFVVEGNTLDALQNAENSLYNCLAELITLFYSEDIKFLDCDCFTLAPKKQ